MKYSHFITKEKITARPWYVYVGLVYIFACIILLYTRIGYTYNPDIKVQYVTYKQISHDVKKKSWYVQYIETDGDYVTTYKEYYSLKDKEYYETTKLLPHSRNGLCYGMIITLGLISILYFIVFLYQSGNTFTENPLYAIFLIAIAILSIAIYINVF